MRRYLGEFERGGLERLRRLNWQGKACELGGHQQSPEGCFTGHPPRPAREAQAAVERLTGTRRGLSQVRALMKKKLG